MTACVFSSVSLCSIQMHYAFLNIVRLILQRQLSSGIVCLSLALTIVYTGTEIKSIMTGPRKSNGFHHGKRGVRCYSAQLAQHQKAGVSFVPPDAPFQCKSEAGPESHKISSSAFTPATPLCVKCDLVNWTYITSTSWPLSAIETYAKMASYSYQQEYPPAQVGAGQPYQPFPGPQQADKTSFVPHEVQHLYPDQATPMLPEKNTGATGSGSTLLTVKRSIALAVIGTLALLLATMIGLAAGLGVSQKNLHDAKNDLKLAQASITAGLG